MRSTCFEARLDVRLSTCAFTGVLSYEGQHHSPILYQRIGGIQSVALRAVHGILHAQRFCKKRVVCEGQRKRVEVPMALG